MALKQDVVRINYIFLDVLLDTTFITLLGWLYITITLCTCVYVCICLCRGGGACVCMSV